MVDTNSKNSPTDREVFDVECRVEVTKYLSGLSNSIPKRVLDHVLAIWLIEHSSKPNERKYKKYLIHAAVGYIVYAKAGLIDDKHYNATVRDAYGLPDTDLVKDWVRRYSDEIHPPLDNPCRTVLTFVREGIKTAGEEYKAIHHR